MELFYMVMVAIIGFGLGFIAFTLTKMWFLVFSLKSNIKKYEKLTGSKYDGTSWKTYLFNTSVQTVMFVLLLVVSVLFLKYIQVS